MEKDKRYYWLDILKIIACFCVLINHTGGLILEVNKSNPIVLFYITRFAISKIGVPLFIMITGYLLLNHDDGYKKILKRIIRILVPLLLLSFYSYTRQFGFHLLAFFEMFLKDPIVIPYWYLYMLIGLYLVTPFVKKMITNFNLKDYKIFISIFLILPSILLLIPLFTNINFNAHFTEAFFPIVIGYYLAGVFISKLKLNKKNLILAILAFIIPIIFFITTTYITYLNLGEIKLKLDSWIYLTTTLPSLALFYIIRYFFENKKMHSLSKKIISTISQTTFGIYLFHYLVVFKLYDLNIFKTLFSFNSILGVITLEVTCFIICGIASFILKKIPIVKKYL